MSSAPSDLSHSYDDLRLDRRGNPPYRLLRGVNDGLVRRFERALADPRRAQRKLLAKILRAARSTAFARDYGLAGVRDLERFRARVPIAGFERFAPYVERIAAGERGVLTRARVLQFLETSGTTGAAKLIPVTRDYARGVSHAQTLWVLGLLREHEALAKGSALTLVSPAEHGRTAGGVPYGSNTGRMHRAQPWWVRLRYPVPYAAYCIEDPEARLYTVLRFALQADVRSISTANPTTVLLICRKLREHREALGADLAGGSLRHGPARDLSPMLRRRLESKLRRQPVPERWSPARIWNLQRINCWKGGSAAWFLPLLPEALGAPLPIGEVGISASECFLGICLSQHWPGCVAWPLGEFQEYVADDGSLHALWELERGATYRTVITGFHGLYRYDLGDLVRVVGRYRNTPVLRFLRRQGNLLNATGEKLDEIQLVRAMERSCQRLGLPRVPFTLRLLMAAQPSYELGLETDHPSDGLAEILDEELGRANVEYAAKRDSQRLGPPSLRRFPQGTYACARAAAVAAGVPDGQYKDPVMALDEATWTRLERAAGQCD